MRPTRAIAWAVAVGALTLTATGCSPDASSAKRPSTPAPALLVSEVTAKPLPSGAPIPHFEGKYASDFTEAYRSSKSDLQREVLEDGKITAKELKALQDGFISCAEPRGLKEIRFGDDGTLRLRPDKSLSEDATSEIYRSCDDLYLGGVELIYNQQQRNPDNQDVSELTAACLVKKGLVPKGYTGDDYANDSLNGTLPFSDSNADARACFNDPLDKLGKK